MCEEYCQYVQNMCCVEIRIYYIRSQYKLDRGVFLYNQCDLTEYLC
jgi:hypothetical protein